MSIGNGNANAIFTKTATLSDSLMPCLAINYSIRPVAGEVATVRYSKATIEYTGSSKEMLITRVAYDEEGSTGTDITYTITGAAAKSAWTGTATAQTAEALTMKDEIDLLNEIPGIQAYVMHCPHSLTVNTTFYEDVTSQDIYTQPAKYNEVLYRTIATNVINTNQEVMFLRVGNPEMRDAGSLKLIGLTVTATDGGMSPVVRLYRDDIRNYDDEYSATYATEIANKQLYIDTEVTTATLTQVVSNDLLTALTYQGPFLLQVSGSALTAATATLRFQQASI